MVAKSGAPLLNATAVAAYKTALLPLATVVTPNLHEAGVLYGRDVTSLEEAREAAMAIKELGPRYVVVKGGDRLGDTAVDILFDGDDFVEFHAEKLDNRNTHGTGCIFASAIATGLGTGLTVADAVALARRLVTAAVDEGLPFGRGEHSPANPLALLSPQLYGE
jgi:hydroxymethylpyrimidine/phosphomethylpyrimidine kinase